MKVEIGLSHESLKSGSDLLNRILSDEFVLYTKLKNYHWNVKGINFNELHKLFDEQAEQISGLIDEVAERVRQLGYRASGSFFEYLNKTRLQEETKENLTSKQMLANILADHEALARNLRKDIELFNNEYADVGTGDFVTGLLQEHEKLAWFVRSHLDE
ncbi:MAG: DNA starvation/stationary phase protection protein [Candidatus Sericytochromatia bacterium]